MSVGEYGLFPVRDLPLVGAFDILDTDGNIATVAYNPSESYKTGRDYWYVVDSERRYCEDDIVGWATSHKQVYRAQRLYEQENFS